MTVWMNLLPDRASAVLITCNSGSDFAASWHSRVAGSGGGLLQHSA